MPSIKVEFNFVPENGMPRHCTNLDTVSFRKYQNSSTCGSNAYHLPLPWIGSSVPDYIRCECRHDNLGRKDSLRALSFCSWAWKAFSGQCFFDSTFNMSSYFLKIFYRSWGGNCRTYERSSNRWNWHYSPVSSNVLPKVNKNPHPD